MADDLRCPECGYSQEDADLHGDHGLCLGKIPKPEHTYCCAPCHVCGDLDGCHIPGKVKRNRDTAKFGQSFPKVICLCGSTRFTEAFRAANLRETLEGNIVLSVGCDMKSDSALGLGAQCKETLDELHKRKIDMADEVLVLNVEGYIGESTRGEINYAKSKAKRIRYLVNVDDIF